MNFKPKLSLTARAIILISMPLIFEVGSTVLLLDLQRQAEVEAEHALKARDLTDRINNLTHKMFEVWSMVDSTNRRAWLSPEFLNGNYKGPLRELREEYAYIYKIALEENDLKLQAAVKDSVDALNQSEVILDRVCNDLRQGHTEELFSESKTVQRSLKRLYQKMVGQEFALVSQEQEKFLKSSPKRLREFRQETINIFLVALAGNIVFSIILAVFLVGRVTSRLEYLASEMRKLGSGQPLAPPLSGGDEIAGLSKTLSALSIELERYLRKEGALVAKARDTICAIDDKGSFQLVNPAGEKLFACPPGSMLASRFIEYIADRDRDRALEWYQNAKVKRPLEEIELEICRSDGKKVTTIWSGQWSPEDRSLFCIVHDISERKEIEAAKQELVAMLTHDLRSPLTTIQACFEMLEAGRLGALNSRGEELVKVAERNGTRMMTLINDLLDIEKIRSGSMPLHKEPVKMADIFEEVRLNLADWMAENKIRLKVHATGQGVMADREKLSRVIFNLVSNAIKFSPPDSLIVLSAARRGSSVEISVTDQGPGIAADKLETIFERFAQVDSPENKGKGGSGLGLTICRAIVNLHGGKIWAESEPGRGTKMIFVLPG